MVAYIAMVLGQPLSLEEMIAKKEEEQKAQSKVR